MLFLKRAEAASPRTAHLQRLGLFSTLSAKELRVIDSLLHERNYLKGEVVFDTGEEGQALYIVLSGKVAVCRQGEFEKARIAEFGEGAMFGELALLDGAPRSLQAVAAEDTVLAALSRVEFNGLLETHAVIASKIALQLARDVGAKLRQNYIAWDARPL
jgi:CRP/FNR family cyclic AMP-dependent transcriptional regulator